MNKSFAIAAALVVGLVVGYGLTLVVKPGPVFPVTTCGGAQCADVTAAGNAITPIPDIKVRTSGTIILWSITTPGWTFAANGIAFVTPPLPPAGTFNCVPGTTTWACNDIYTLSGSGPQTYKYTVNLTSPSGQPVTLDPRIINN
jgi:hypothetical protein